MKTKKILYTLIAFCMLLFGAITVKAQWTAQTSGTSNQLNSVYFTDANTGYAVGEVGKILKTTNGGTNWVSQASGITKDLFSVYFTETNTGYAIGGSTGYGKSTKTINGGTNWATQIDGTTNGLYSVYFIDADTGYAVGYSGIIYKTINGGSNWNWQISGPIYNNPNDLNSVYFTDANTGFIVGNYGTILKTSNGGTNWIDQTSGIISNLKSVYFVDTDTGYTVGYNGTILKTTNGGINWTPQISGTINNLNSVYFVDANTGYVVGNSGTILKTINGGINWETQTSGVTNNLNSVYFTDANIGYAVGSGGKILKAINGGWCTGKPGQPSGGTSFCHPSGNSQYVTTGATYATSYNWSLNPVTAGSISGTGTTATVTWSGTYNGIVSVIVQGVKSGCIGETSSLNVFVNNSNPSTFNLNTPSNGVWVNTTPLFQWSASTGALTYSLYIDGSLKKDNITTTSYQILPIEAISSGMHTWYVVANKEVCSTQSNETWSFRVDGTQPTAFNLISPIDNSWTTSLQPTLTWCASSDVSSGLAKYQLWIDGVLNRDNIASTATSTTPTTALSNGSHTWEIRVVDNVGYVSNSIQIWTVKIDNVAPLNCSLKSPLNNQYLSTTTPNFSWSSASDYGAGIGFEKFQLYIDDTMVKDNLSDSTWTIINPLNYGQHSWFVSSYDSLGNYLFTLSRIFYVDNAKPNPFSLTTPTNNQTVNLPTPNLTWQATVDSSGGSGLSKYQLWINGANNRDSIPISQTTVAPSSALPQGIYAWYIKAFDNMGNARQSTQTWTFYVDWEAPTDFILIDPIDNTTLTNSRPLFKWHSSSDIGSGIDRYELCISGQSPIPILPTDTSNLLTFDLPNGTYTWYVKAYDVAGAFTSSNIHTITINAPLPNQAATPTGTNEFCVNAINTNYTTIGATNATSYIWEITPTGAGTISGIGLICNVDWNNTFTGTAQITVRGHNGAGDGIVSSPILVTIYPVYAYSENHSICNGETYNWRGIDYSIAGNYHDSLHTVNGCDSVYALNLSVINIDASITVSDPTITANASGATYQWLDCNNAFAIIPSANIQSYTAIANGNYAVAIKQGTCIDTSICVQITTVGINIIQKGSIEIYPNPLTNELIVLNNGNTEKTYFEILNSLGQVVFKGNFIEKIILQTAEFAKGVYLIKLENGNTFEFKKIIKE